MMYAVIKVVDGNYSVHTEGHTDINDARHSFYSYCAALSKDEGFQTATVMVVDENLDKVEDYKAFFSNVVKTSTNETEATENL
jgi:hypothetical protein